MESKINRLLIVIAVVSLPIFSMAKVNRIYQNVRVSKTITLAPHQLCHNGLYLFFKNSDYCRQQKIPNFDCDKNYEIAPLRTSEEISLVEDGPYVTRFYHIQLRYHYQEVDAENDVVLVNDIRTISACEDRKLYVTENVRSRRVVRNNEEKFFISSLINQSSNRKDQSWLLLNSPVGNVGNFESLSAPKDDDHDKKRRSSIIKTPFCNNKYNPDQVWNLSGEYTGSGKRGLLPATLQLISEPLYVQKRTMILNKETQSLEPQYEFTCKKGMEL